MPSRRPLPKSCQAPKSPNPPTRSLQSKYVFANLACLPYAVGYHRTNGIKTGLSYIAPGIPPLSLLEEIFRRVSLFLTQSIHRFRKKTRIFAAHTDASTSERPSLDPRPDHRTPLRFPRPQAGILLLEQARLSIRIRVCLQAYRTSLKIMFGFSRWVWGSVIKQHFKRATNDVHDC